MVGEPPLLAPARRDQVEVEVAAQLALEHQLPARWRPFTRDDGGPRLGPATAATPGRGSRDQQQAPDRFAPLHGPRL
jgi:hypothetical protein